MKFEEQKLPKLGSTFRNKLSGYEMIVTGVCQEAKEVYLGTSSWISIDELYAEWEEVKE